MYCFPSSINKEFFILVIEHVIWSLQPFSQYSDVLLTSRMLCALISYMSSGLWQFLIYSRIFCPNAGAKKYFFMLRFVRDIWAGVWTMASCLVSTNTRSLGLQRCLAILKHLRKITSNKCKTQGRLLQLDFLFSVSKHGLILLRKSKRSNIV